MHAAALAQPTPTPRDITALVLAGGRGSRMGGLDKGLQNFHGTPLALHALARLRQQTWPPAALAISANRHLDAYQGFDVPVWPDTLSDFAGPLAGFLSGLQHCATPLLLTVPCDVPLFPLTLCERLAHALHAQGAELALAAAPAPEGSDDPCQSGPLRPQPVFCLLRTRLRDDLARFLQAGERRIGAFVARHRSAVVPFDTPSDEPRAFANANTLAELRTLQQQETPCPATPPSAC